MPGVRGWPDKTTVLAPAPAALLDCIGHSGPWQSRLGSAGVDGPEETHGRALVGPPEANRAVDEAVDGYAQAALARETREVERAGGGERAHRLNLAALRLGALSAAGVLDAAAVRSKLQEAAAINGLVKEDGIRAVRATIESGFRKG